MKRIAVVMLALVALAVLEFSFAERVSQAAIPPAPLVPPSRELQFTEVVHVPALPAGRHDLRIWVPLPYEDISQSISQLRIVAPVEYKVRREAEYGDKYAYLQIDSARVKTPCDIRLTFHAKRFEHRVALTGMRDTADEPIIAIQRFLQPDALVPVNGVIADLSREQTDHTTLPLEKARKIYDYVIATMHYDHDGTGWGRGDAMWACNAKHGNCTDFHSLFIGMARAASIPARFKIGFPLPTDRHDGAITSYHCWADFYISGIGWIPVDASEAWKHPEEKEFFFGGLDVNRVMFTMGRDITLVPAQKGGPLNYSIYPYAELDGAPFADLKNDYSFRDDASGTARPARAGH